jgi:hypothetical protein
VLKQSGQATYPVALKDDTSIKDGFIEVKFQAIYGKEGQAGGVILRVKDENNYYICRTNALEDNCFIWRRMGNASRWTLWNVRVAMASRRRFHRNNGKYFVSNSLVTFKSYLMVNVPSTWKITRLMRQASWSLDESRQRYTV